jgi:hypothetical protein
MLPRIAAIISINLLFVIGFIEKRTLQCYYRVHILYNIVLKEKTLVNVRKCARTDIQVTGSRFILLHHLN